MRARTSACLLALVLLVTFAGCATPAKNNAAASPAQTRELYVFNGRLDFNESTLGIPHDIFVPDHLVVNKGDTVVIHFFNTEEDEMHTYTMDAPYAVNDQVPAGAEQNITFVATQAGIFAYKCLEHQPTMTGYLVVLG